MKDANLDSFDWAELNLNRWLLFASTNDETALGCGFLYFVQSKRHSQGEHLQTLDIVLIAVEQ